MIKFNKYYFISTIILFLIELFIALYVKDQFIRPFGGDVLVVLLIYCFVRSFWSGNTLKIALGVLFFSFSIEILQYFNFVNLLRLQDYRIATVVLGSTFSWLDLLAYMVGFLIIIGLEKWINKKII